MLRNTRQMPYWAETQYRALYEQAPDAYFSLEPSTGRILHCNSAVRSVLGYDPEELTGRPIRILAALDTGDQARENWQALVQCAELRDADIRIKRKDGGKADVSANATSVRDDKGRVVLGLTVWRDISRWKRLELEQLDHQRQLRALAHEISVAEERARKKIACWLHDEIGQVLAMTKITFGALVNAQPDPSSRKLIDSAVTLIDQAGSSHARSHLSVKLSCALRIWSCGGGGELEPPDEAGLPPSRPLSK